MAEGQRKYYKWSRDDLQKALVALEKKEMSLNQISATYVVPKATILRHARRRNKIANDSEVHKGRPTIFKLELEQILVQHILDLEKHLFGLTINDVRRLAFDIAEKHNIPHTFNKRRQMAGKAWFYAFKGRHPQLSVRQPESTSMNRVRGFNKENVFGFYDILEKVVDENQITASKIFNVDESGFSTVQKKPQKVIGLKGKKQIGAITSGERGVNTTAVCCASASGQFVPPMLIFKRARQNPELGNGAHPGTVVTISESGYINSALFVDWIKHFIDVVKPTHENKILLLLDGHTTHSKNLEALNLAKDNGVIMLQLPGHTTHRLQPLDVSFFKPMSTYYIQAMEKWLRTNPGRHVTQYQVASLFTEAYERAAVIGNVCNGFKAAGVWPVNRSVFPEHLFQSAENMNADSSRTSNDSTSILQDLSVVMMDSNDNCSSNQLNAEPEDINKENRSPTPPTQIQLPKNLPQDLDVKPSTSGLNIAELNKSLKTLCPLPKSKQKKKNSIQKAVEITSSPYKHKLEQSKAAKQKKNTVKTERNKLKNSKEKSKNQKKVKDTNKRGLVQNKKIGKSQKRKRSSTTSSSSSEDIVLELSDSTDVGDDENVSALCGGHYYDKKGPTVEWLQCVRCHRWVHETCSLFVIIV